MFGEILKVIFIITIVHLLFYIIDGKQLFDEFFLKLIMYLIIGYILYYLIVKKIFDRLSKNKK